MSLFNIQPIFVPPVILWNISLRKFWDFRQPETIGGTNLSTIGACWRKSLHYISKIFFKIQVGGLLNEGGTSDRWKISLQISLKLDFFKEHQWHIWFFLKYWKHWFYFVFNKWKKLKLWPVWRNETVSSHQGQYFDQLTTWFCSKPFSPSDLGWFLLYPSHYHLCWFSCIIGIFFARIWKSNDFFKYIILAMFISENFLICGFLLRQ